MKAQVLSLIWMCKTKGKDTQEVEELRDKIIGQLSAFLKHEDATVKQVGILIIDF